MNLCVCVCVCVCVRACVHACVCVCVAKPEAVELRCHATALILVIGKTQFRRAMLSCDSSCLPCLTATNGVINRNSSPNSTNQETDV